MKLQNCPIEHFFFSKQQKTIENFSLSDGTIFCPGACNSGGSITDLTGFVGLNMSTEPSKKDILYFCLNSLIRKMLQRKRISFSTHRNINIEKLPISKQTETNV